MKRTNSRLQRLAVSAMLIGLGTALSLIKIGAPFGGSITAGAMVPLVIISQLYGFGWGTLCCTVYGALQIILGLNNFSYVSGVVAIIVVVLFDYVVAYGVMGFSALTRKMKSPAAGAAVGSVIGCALRFICHFITGAYIWGEWADAAILPGFMQETMWSSGKPLLYSYSFFYNIGYMLPETIITAVLSAAVIGIVYKVTANNNKTAAPAAGDAAAVEEAAGAAEAKDSLNNAIEADYIADEEKAVENAADAAENTAE